MAIYDLFFAQHMFKRFACLAFVLAAMPIHTQTLHLLERLAIKDNWTFRQAHQGAWLPVPIPVSAHTALLKHGLIEDPYYRDNESKLQWIEQEDWEFQTTFEVSEAMLQFRHVEMSLKGLDTYAQVYLNDSLVAETDNMFRAWQLDVKKYLRKGTNTLHIYFESPIQKAQTEWDALGYQLPGGIRTMTRKAQFHYGWDWGPRFVGCGIQEAPEIVMWNDMLIENVYVTPRELTDARARMVVHVRYRADFEGKVTLITRNGKAKILEDRYVYPGVHEDSMTFDIDQPRLWWCRGMGEPYLYDIHFEIRAGVKTIESTDLRFGLRTIELVTEPDGNGRTFYFKLNGKPVFAKGANYIPQDLFQDRVTPAQYRTIIDAAADANMNMLRVWGGGIYEDDLFYQLCDAKGILVWQDFMYACAMYPGSGGFLKTASKEADQQIERLRQHPCIALWCGNNENNEAWYNWGWQMQFSEAQRAKLWQDYKTLFNDLLPTYVENYALGVPYWESSPQHGRLTPKSMREGDAHYWGVWHDEEPFEVLNHKVPRFMSEFGFQAFPAWETIEAFTLPEDRKLDSPVMLLHQKHPRGNALIATYMKRAYGVPTDFEHFVYLSQVLQAEGMRVGLEAHRRNKPYCMGTLYWQLNDVWPVASWSSIDSYGRWKALHYTARDAFKPVAVLPFVDEETLKVYGVTDDQDNVKASLKVQIMDFDGRLQEEFVANNLTLHTDSAKLMLELPLSKWPEKKRNDLMATCVLTAPDGSVLHRRTVYFAPPKNQRLPKTNIALQAAKTDKGYEITLKSDKLARNIYLRSSIDGFFKDNFFDLLPGETRTTLFVPTKPGDPAPAFKVMSVVDAMP